MPAAVPALPVTRSSYHSPVFMARLPGTTMLADGWGLYHGIFAPAWSVLKNAPARGARSSARQGRREEAVGAVEVGKQPQKHTRIEGDARFAQQLRAIELVELRMRAEKRRDDVLVLLGEQAAGRVYQPTTGLYQPRGGVEYRR